MLNTDNTQKEFFIVYLYLGAVREESEEPGVPPLRGDQAGLRLHTGAGGGDAAQLPQGRPHVPPAPRSRPRELHQCQGIQRRLSGVNIFRECSAPCS